MSNSYIRAKLKKLNSDTIGDYSYITADAVSALADSMFIDLSNNLVKLSDENPGSYSLTLKDGADLSSYDYPKTDFDSDVFVGENIVYKIVPNTGSNPYYIWIAPTDIIYLKNGDDGKWVKVGDGDTSLTPAGSEKQPIYIDGSKTPKPINVNAGTYSDDKDYITIPLIKSGVISDSSDIDINIGLNKPSLLCINDGAIRVNTTANLGGDNDPKLLYLSNGQFKTYGTSIGEKHIPIYMNENGTFAKTNSQDWTNRVKVQEYLVNATKGKVYVCAGTNYHRLDNWGAKQYYDNAGFTTAGSQLNKLIYSVYVYGGLCTISFMGHLGVALHGANEMTTEAHDIKTDLFTNRRQLLVGIPAPRDARFYMGNGCFDVCSTYNNYNNIAIPDFGGELIVGIFKDDIITKTDGGKYASLSIGVMSGSQYDTAGKKIIMNEDTSESGNIPSSYSHVESILHAGWTRIRGTITYPIDTNSI